MATIAESIGQDGISRIQKAIKKGLAVSFVSGRATCPMEMVTAMMMQSWPTNTALQIANVYGTDTAQGRINAVKEAQSKGCKYIWFLDDDTVPPFDAGRHLLYLLEQHPNAMVAAGVYCTRSTPPEPTIYREEGAGCDWDWKVGETFQRWGAGTGCMMINLEIFNHIEEPWFLTTQTAEHRETDDLYFCKKVAAAGFELWIDGGILCHHYDLERGAVYMLPRESYPYVNRIKEPREPRNVFV